MESFKAFLVPVILGIIIMTNDKKIRNICRYSYTRRTNGLPQDGQRLCRQLENEARISLIQYLDVSNCPLLQINKCDVESSLDDFEKERMRDRIDKEDSLLNTRTQLFLMINGIWLTGALVSGKISKPEELALLLFGISFFGALITLIWFLSSHQSKRIIIGLHEKMDKIENDTLIKPFLYKRECFRPTALLTILLPFLVFHSWVSYFLWLLFYYKMILSFTAIVLLILISLILFFVAYYFCQKRQEGISAKSFCLSKQFSNFIQV